LWLSLKLEMSSTNVITKSNWNELMKDIRAIHQEIVDITTKQLAFAKSIKLLDKNMAKILSKLEKESAAEDDSGNDSDQTTKTTRTGRTARSTRSSARNDLTLKDFEEKANAIPGFVTRFLGNFQDLEDIQYK